MKQSSNKLGKLLPKIQWKSVSSIMGIVIRATGTDSKGTVYELRAKDPMKAILKLYGRRR